MADLSDVENAIVLEVTGALYPVGIAELSVVGATCRVYRGWPSPAALNTDLSAGVVNVTIFPATESDEIPVPYFDRQYAPPALTSLMAAVTGQSVTFSGTTTSSQIVGLLIDGVPVCYNVGESDTPDSIAANLMVLVGTNRPAILSGSTLTIPGAATLIARVVTNSTVSQGLRRQRKEIRISCWCPSPVIRDSVCISVDLAMASSSFINLADNTMAHVHYVSTQVYDQSQNALLYRRDLCYKCEYTTVITATAQVMLFGDLLANGSGSFV